jgi:hypothetical protein
VGKLKIWVFFLLFLSILNLQACSKSREAQLRERVDRYLKLQTFKDYEGMSEFILKEDNVAYGGYTFKDSKEFFFSVFKDSNLILPLEKYEILEINTYDSNRRADVKIGCTHKMGLTSGTGTVVIKWLYLDDWYIDITDGSIGCDFVNKEG